MRLLSTIGDSFNMSASADMCKPPDVCTRSLTFWLCQRSLTIGSTLDPVPPTYPPLPLLLSQWFGCKSPQTRLPLHVPQASMPPHPSATLPQSSPSASQVVGVQPHLFGPRAPHVPFGHVPQCNVPPHPLGASPQSKPSVAQVAGVHGPAPHRFGPAAPQT
jgi:hypothetical protein